MEAENERARSGIMSRVCKFLLTFCTAVSRIRPRKESALRSACDGLAAAIESGQFDNPDVLALVETHCAPLRERGVDTVVLGCTHYTFVRQQIQAAMGTAVQIVDTAEAVARHAANTVRKTRPDADNTPGQAPLLTLQTTGDAALFRRFVNTWLGKQTAVSRVAI